MIQEYWKIIPFHFLKCKDSSHIWICNQLFIMTISSKALGPLHHAILKWSRSTKIFSGKESVLVSEICWTISRYYRLETSRQDYKRQSAGLRIWGKKDLYKVIYLLQTLIFQICSTNAHHIQACWVSWPNLCVWNVSVSRQLLYFFLQLRGSSGLQPNSSLRVAGRVECWCWMATRLLCPCQEATCRGRWGV